MDVLFSYVVMCGILYPVFANPSPISVDQKKVKDEVNWQNLQLTLLSIEEKLRNLESFVIVQCGTRFNGKIDYYGRKIDNIEKTLSKMEMQTKLELEKISENISSKNFKEDISNERIIRNIDIVHEKLNHKLTAIEQRADLSTIKMKNIGETVTAKLEKLEDNFMIRDSDVETELSEVVNAIDDLKTGHISFEQNMIKLITQSTETFENLLTNQYTRLESALDTTTKNITQNIQGVQETMQKVLNETENTTEMINVSKEEVFDNMNEYANKIIDIHTDLWNKADFITSKVHELSKTATLSRNEQQNSLRGLTVQLGRLSGKPHFQVDSQDYSKLDELNKKIDENFQNVMLTQNMFLESCHRVQMDEAQIESQIGAVLNKLIDTFENKTSVTVQDIQRLEQSINTHDSATKQCLQNTLNNVQDLFKVVKDEHLKILQNINKQKENIGIIGDLLQNITHSKEERLTQTVLETVKELEKQVAENSNILSNQNNITKLLLKINLQQNFNFSTFISSVTTDLSDIKENTNTLFVNTDKFANLIRTITAGANTTGPNIEELIRKIFVKTPDPSILDSDHFKITRKGIENLIRSLNHTGTFSEKIDNYTYSVRDQNHLRIVKCLPHYLDIIDVRFNPDDELLNCTSSKITRSPSCLPNYLDIIDVRYNRDNCTTASTETVETSRVLTERNDQIIQQVAEDWGEYAELTTGIEEEGHITFSNDNNTNP
ncbi:uncharacterized protein LOC116170595 [Photinus pyralis]|nr:uncharacterized protein LOC116170595 [Photinus pyralis]